MDGERAGRREAERAGSQEARQAARQTIVRQLGRKTHTMHARSALNPRFGATRLGFDPAELLSVSHAVSVAVLFGCAAGRSAPRTRSRRRRRAVQVRGYESLQELRQRGDGGIGKGEGGRER
eukprot:4756931-Pleurochrysis_carterae.AAC.1